MEFTIQNAGERLDKILVARLPDFSRAQIQHMISNGLVKVDGQSAKSGHKMKGGERVVVDIPPNEEQIIAPEDIPLMVVYEDDDIAVIDKGADMVVHPGIGQESGTLVNALLAHYPQIIDMQDDPRAEGRMGIVHRLDKDTSGLIVTAKHITALENLMTQFQVRNVEKTYLALLERTPKTDKGIIEAPIGRDPKQRKRMAVVKEGKHALSEYEIIDLQFRDGRCLVKIKIHTGRTHQIRVHMAFIGCPIIGDTVYGYNRQRVGLKRNFLHASELSFDHPTTGERQHFQSELPIGLQNVMGKLREKSNFE
ncbi:MAG: RluA family pseudouridine synthase [Anaerolineae bacterium]|nr:RluA family pseudouridine synthase [Anaerolineae bacterium]